MSYKTDTATDPVETGALVIDGPQPVWMTLNDAREQAFTGEIVFEADPEVFAYLDNGIVYFAERADDAPLGQRLLDAGVVDGAQLERGLVRIGDLEHLGRLFDRDQTIDRDAVIVTAELFTEELISELANQAIANVRVAAYRHHRSGVHRWFVAPVEQTVVARPIGMIGQLDATVVDDLPGLPYGLEEDDLMIEWDVVDATDDVDDVAELTDDEHRDAEVPDAAVQDAAAQTEQFTDDVPALVEELVVVEEFEFVEQVEFLADPADIDVPDDGDLELSLELVDVEFVDDSDSDEQASEALLLDIDLSDLHLPGLDVADDAVDELDGEIDGPVVAGDARDDSDDSVDDDDFEFSVVWPDGSEQAPDTGAADDHSGDVEAAFTETDDGEFQFSMPPLTLSDEPEAADAEVPDDVADAVRRAIAAIESASVAEPSVEDAVDVFVGEVDDPDTYSTDDTDVADEAAIFDQDDVSDEPLAAPPVAAAAVPAPASASASAPAPSTDDVAGFAPPTMATRAEVLYGQMADDGSVVDAPVPAPTLAQQPTPAVAGDGHGNDEGGERESALRRLIGSLRRKDH